MDRRIKDTLYCSLLILVIFFSAPVHSINMSEWISTYAIYDIAPEVTAMVNESDNITYTMEKDKGIHTDSWNDSLSYEKDYLYAILYVEIDYMQLGGSARIEVNQTGTYSQCGSCQTSIDFTGIYSCNLTEQCSIDTIPEINGLDINVLAIDKDIDIDHIMLHVYYIEDTTPATINFVEPTPIDDSHWSQDHVYVNVSIIELYIDTIMLNWNGTNETMDDPYTNKTDLIDGVYDYHVWVNDTSGNSNQTETRTVIVDTVAPSITINSPFNVTYPQITIAFNLTVSELYEDTCQYNLDDTYYVDMPYNETFNIYYAENSTMTQGMHEVMFMCNDTAGNQNLTGNVYFTVDISSPTAPVNILPYNTDHTNINQTNFTWTESYDMTAIDAYQLQISNSTGFETVNMTLDIEGITDLYYTVPAEDNLGDGIYHWRVRANDTVGNDYGNWSDPFIVVIDTIFPDWTLNSYPAFYNDSLVSASITWDSSVNDVNLYRILLNVTNMTGYEMYSNYTSDWNESTYTFNNTINISDWADGNYTVELSATDDHTHGSLNGLVSQRMNGWVRFSQDDNVKGIYLGHYNINHFQLFNDQQIEDNNISIRSYDAIDGEIKFDILFDRPATDYRLGIAIPKDDMNIRDAGKGHFIWKDWYLDFDDMASEGWTMEFEETDEYYIIYTYTEECNEDIGIQCRIDPVLGGLNTRTEYYLIEIDNSAPAISDFIISDDLYNIIEINESTTGIVYAEWNATDPYLNVSTCRLNYRAYDSINNEYANWSFINGSLDPELDSQGWKEYACNIISSNPENTTVRVNMNLTDDNEWRPGTFNFDHGLVSKDTSFTVYKDSIIKVQLDNVTVSPNTSYIFEFQVDEASISTSIDFRVYGCNLNYTDGLVQSSPYCTPAEAINVGDVYDNQQYYDLLFISDENSTFNGIPITETMYAIGTSFNALNSLKGWDVWATSGIECGSRYQRSIDAGVTWTDETGSCGNHHLHFFNGFTGEFNLTIADALGNMATSIEYDLLGSISNFAPELSLDIDEIQGSLITMYNTTGIVERGILHINTTVTDPNQDDVNCSYYLLNDDMSYNKTLLPVYELNASFGTCTYLWNTASEHDGDYYISVNVTDGILVSNDILDYAIRLDNTPPILSAVTINATPTTIDDTQVNVTVTEPNIDTVLFEYNMSINYTVTDFSDTEYWYVIDHLSYIAGDIIYYRYHVNDTAGHLTASSMQSFMVSSTPPEVINNALYPASIFANESLYLDISCHDIDLPDTVIAYWDIYNGIALIHELSGSVLINLSELTTVYTIGSFNFSGGDLIRSKVICSDTIVNSTSVTSEPAYIQNSPPELDTLRFTDIAFNSFEDGTAFAYNNIYLHVHCSDNDIGQVQTVLWNITRDGAIVDSLSGSDFILQDISVHVATIPATNTAYGDIWSATGQCYDGMSASAIHLADNLTIFIPETILTHTKGYDATSKAGGLVTGIVENTNLAVAMITLTMVLGGILLLLR